MNAATGGPAEAFWRAVESRRLELQWTKRQLADRSGVARPTIDRLRSGTRTPQVVTVHALADALGIARSEAEKLAGISPEVQDAPTDKEVRAAIARSRIYTHQQRLLLFGMLDALDQANRSQPR